MKLRATLFFAVLFTIFTFSACKEVVQNGGSSASKPFYKEITSFKINNIPATVVGTSISITLPYGTSKAALIPTIVQTGTSVSPASGVAQNFSNPVPYTVIAKDGSKKVYTVNVAVAPNFANDITQFAVTVNGTAINGVINGSNISLTVPYGTDLSTTQLTPTIYITGASVSPASGDPHSFNVSPQIYTVTAADGSTNDYAVTVTVALNSAKDFTAFSILGYPGTIGAHTITLVLPYGQNLSSLTPDTTITGVSFSPTTPSDFSTGPKIYTVTAADGSTKDYTVVVTAALNSAKEITAFSILGLPGTIDITNHITLVVPYDTGLLALTPTITITGNTVSPASGVQNDFTSPQTYTVRAADGSTKDYLVTVTEALNPAKEITAFSIYSIPGTIDGINRTISLVVPYGTGLLALTPTITITGDIVSPASGVQNDFTSPQTYTVRAADGSTKDYLVTVTEALNSAKDITDFMILNTHGAIDVINHTITLLVPYCTNLSALTPTITITGNTVSLGSGIQNDFTSPQTYTVTAADGSQQAYIVNVMVAAPAYNLRDVGPAGGLIFYINPTCTTDGWVYLEAAPSDRSSTQRWSNLLTTIGTTSQNVGTGNTNTNMIINQVGHTDSAANACKQTSVNGYGDWFLPSLGELNLMFSNLKALGVGGFVNNYYWSSSENPDKWAFVKAFYLYGEVTNNQKNLTNLPTRCIRKF